MSQLHAVSIADPDVEAVEFNGERYVPHVRGSLRIEHVHRYLLALELVDGKDVLDIACGEGYGSAALAERARTTLGVDIDALTVTRAASKYRSSNCKFLEGSVTDIPAENASFDVVVCFETIEHIGDQQRAISEIRRVLRPGGLLLISTPNALASDNAWHDDNPYHVKELTESEFKGLLHEQFKNVVVMEQRFLHGSVLLPIDASVERATLLTSDDGFRYEYSHGNLGKFYLVAVASQNPLPKLPLHCLDGITELTHEREEHRYAVGEMHRLQREVQDLRTYCRLRDVQIAALRNK